MLDHIGIKRAYASLSPVYDILFNRVFHDGRTEAIRAMALRPGNHVLEVGVGTGLSLPLYPENCRVTGIDISEEMLARARERAAELDGNRFQLQIMDCAELRFPDGTFDHVLAAYVISVVPDPVRALREMRRVCRPGGSLIILNHFRSENRLLGTLEDILSPMCHCIGFNTDVRLRPILDAAGLEPRRVKKVNLLNGWRLVQCTSPGPFRAPHPNPGAGSAGRTIVAAENPVGCARAARSPRDC